MRSPVRSFEELVALLVGSEGGHAGASAGGESCLLLAILDFVECCFKKRARAGRGRGASRLCRFTSTSDGASGLLLWSESTEEFWATAGAATTLLTSEQSVLTLSLLFNEFKRSLSVLTFLFVTTVSTFFADDVSLCVLPDMLSLLGTSLLFKAVVLVLVRSVL